jgi:predicted nucleic acid-binding protein
MSIIADTSFIVAHFNRKDASHHICLTAYQNYRGSIQIPQSVLAEVGYMLRKAGGNHLIAEFLRRLSEMKYQVLPLQPEDLIRTAEILDKYHDTRLDFVDASVVAVAERLNITRILTLDQRDFRLVQPRHTPYLELLPPPA